MKLSDCKINPCTVLNNSKKELVSLRDLIRQLAAAAGADNHCISLTEYENKMWVLNWLIEKIEFKDK